MIGGSQGPEAGESLDAAVGVLQDTWQTLRGLLPEILISVVILTVAFFLGRAAGRLLERALARGRVRAIQRRFFGRVVSWMIFLVGLMIVLTVLGLRTAAAGLLAGGGITAIILGFAFRQMGENFLAGLFLAFSSPFKVGDLIESSGQQGTVRSIELHSTHIRTADGRDIFIPNSQIIGQPLINFTRDGYLRPVFTLGIDYADDLAAAIRILMEELGRVDDVLDNPEPRVVIDSLEAAWVEIEVSFWIDVFKEGVDRLSVRTTAMRRCVEALLGAGFTLSSDTTTALKLTSAPPIDVRRAERGD